MPKLQISIQQNQPIYQGRVFPYLAVTELIVKLPVSSVGDRFEGGVLTAKINAFAEIEDSSGLVRIYHPDWKRSITIPNFEPQGALLQVAAGLIQSQLSDIGAIGVVE